MFFTLSLRTSSLRRTRLTDSSSSTSIGCSKFLFNEFFRTSLIAFVFCYKKLSNGSVNIFQMVWKMMSSCGISLTTGVGSIIGVSEYCEVLARIVGGVWASVTVGNKMRECVFI